MSVDKTAIISFEILILSNVLGKSKETEMPKQEKNGNFLLKLMTSVIGLLELLKGLLTPSVSGSGSVSVTIGTHCDA